MAEALAIVGSVGAICSLVAGISKVILLITDLTAIWDDADLTLLSMASQLTALRAATTKIQEWMERGLQDAHHQLTMDLDVSIKCCHLLITKVEAFLSELSDFTEKPLDLRNKFKLVFGSAGPENVQKLIERQTSALTLLLTACNCNTLSEQQRHLETSKTRKVLKRAQADSVSLCAQRDTASFASKMTDNLSKISRVFEFDPNIFSTRVYERAFRGSIKQALRQHQVAPLSKQRLRYNRVHFLGNDEVGKNIIINALGSALSNLNAADWILYRSQLQQLCVDLLCTIIKRGTPDWNTEHAAVILSYSQGAHEIGPSFTEALDACAILWWSSLRRLHEPDPDPQGYLRERIEFKDMIFHVDIIPAGGLNIYCGNTAARIFLDQMERALPLRTTEPRYAMPLTADSLRASALLSSDDSFECHFRSGTFGLHLTGISKRAPSWPSFQDLQSALALGFVFDLQDYGNGTCCTVFEVQTRLDTALMDLASLENRGCPNELPFLLLLINADQFRNQIKNLGYVLTNQRLTNDYDLAITDIETRFRGVVKLPLTSLVLNIEPEVPPAELLTTLERIGNERNGLRAIVESEEQK